MNAREWALIVFTVLTQMSVGSFLVLGVVHFFAARKAGMEEADRLSDRALLSIVVVLALAMLASYLFSARLPMPYLISSSTSTHSSRLRQVHLLWTRWGIF